MTYVTTRPAFPIGTVAPLRCTRASQRAGLDARGRYRLAAVNEASLDFGPDGQLRGIARFPARTNYVRNARLEGGTSSANPTYMAQGGGGSGLTLSRSYGTDSGLPYMDFTLTGTATSTTYLSFTPENGNPIPCAQGDTITAAAFFKLVDGDWPSGSCTMIHFLRDASNNDTESSNISIKTAAGLPLTRGWVHLTHTVAQAATVSGFWQIRIRWSAGEEVNVRFRMALPSMEAGDYPTLHALPPVGAPQAITTLEEDLRVDPQAVATRPWFDPMGGTIFFEGITSRPAPASQNGYAGNLFHMGMISSLPFRNRLTAALNRAQNQLQFSPTARATGVTLTINLPAQLQEGALLRVALSWRPGLVIGAANGLTAQSPLDRIMSTYQALQIGAGASGAMGGWTRKIWVQRKPFSAAELAAWSAV